MLRRGGRKIRGELFFNFYSYRWSTASRVKRLDHYIVVRNNRFSILFYLQSEDPSGEKPAVNVARAIEGRLMLPSIL